MATSETNSHVPDVGTRLAARAQPPGKPVMYQEWRDSFVDDVNTRDVTATDPKLAGGLSTEGMVFIGRDVSPTREPLLAVAFTASGTVTIATERKGRPAL